MTAGNVTLLKLLDVCLHSLACRLANNYLTNFGRDMSGLIALAAALKDSQISILE